MIKHIDPTLTIEQIQDQYGVSRRTAYRAKSRGYLSTSGKGRAHTRQPQGLKLDNAQARLIALRTGKRVSRDYDTQQEVAQAVLIELWISGITDEPLAYKAALRAGFKSLRAEKRHQHVTLEQYMEDTGETQDD